MTELRVPTVGLAAEILCADGRSFRGRIFVPATASRHPGPMRPEEWMNEPTPFFPFLPDEATAPVILNKTEVLVVDMPRSDEADALDEPTAPRRRVLVELGERRLKGSLVIDMPENRSRVLYVLNRPEAFLMLKDGERQQLVQKQRITRVLEVREE